MFRQLTVITLGMLVSSVAAAQDGIVVWMELEVPDEKALERTDNRTGGTTHLGAWDMAFPPMPADATDDERYESLRLAVEGGKKRWNDFEVEYGIATDIEAILTEIDVIRSDRDFADLTEARLFQGAAVHVAFEPDEFRDGERAAPFRWEIVGGVANMPWAQAMALDPERVINPSDVADGASFPALQDTWEALGRREDGTLKLAPVAPGDTLVVDGRDIAPGTETLSVRAGDHYIHVLRDGTISGRQKVFVDTGRTTEMPVLVDEDERNTARTQILAGTTTGFPEDVKTALQALARHHGGTQVFVAAQDGSRMVVLPYSYGAELLKQRPVTVVGAGEMGGGILSSSVLDSADGNLKTVPMAQGSLSFELGIYNAAILAGMDLGFVPSHIIKYGNADQTENEATSVLPQPWGGLGAYLLRPTGDTPTFMVAGTYGWNGPSHFGVGGRLSLGVPVDPKTWLRLSLGASTAGKSTWDEGNDKNPMHVVFFRSGLASRF